jgi:hypothetical protein
MPEVMVISSKYGNIKEYRLVGIWQCMKRRCNDMDNKDYGGRGIRICEKWENSFKSFYDWSINNGYSDKLSIDRIEVNENYEPGNCGWTDNVTQSNNKRNNRHIVIRNESKTLCQWTKQYNMPFSTVHQRLKYGWNVEDALKTPLKVRCNSMLFFRTCDTEEELKKLDEALKKLGYKDRADWYREMKREAIRKALK